MLCNLQEQHMSKQYQPARNIRHVGPTEGGATRASANRPRDNRKHCGYGYHSERERGERANISRKTNTKASATRIQNTPVNTSNVSKTRKNGPKKRRVRAAARASRRAAARRHTPGRAANV
ncbi:unnamed protein product [Arctia plantaginis]|uniref:Uncharacterized protein n=1 Tax=Arctia plantaginis TaxID=874455 RepID=A0A8S1AH57_ARCPL|nr:unnamed protein product [Arctia plantaginis]CAB3253654.1 unnamed protein product [Arctia plantaginis]